MKRSRLLTDLSVLLLIVAIFVFGLYFLMAGVSSIGFLITLLALCMFQLWISR